MVKVEYSKLGHSFVTELSRREMDDFTDKHGRNQNWIQFCQKSGGFGVETDMNDGQIKAALPSGEIQWVNIKGRR